MKVLSAEILGTAVVLRGELEEEVGRKEGP
jgi:hypothetical protein